MSDDLDNTLDNNNSRVEQNGEVHNKYNTENTGNSADSFNNRNDSENPLQNNNTKSSQKNNDPASMGLLDHLNELRSRLTKSVIFAAIGFGACWAFVDPLFNILTAPLLEALPAGTHAQYTTLPEAFFARMFIAFIAGLFAVSPAIFYQVWAFVAPGLYDEEKKYIVPIAFVSAVFFVGGALFCYYIVFPFAFNFFLSFSTPEIEVTPKISDYLSFTIKLLFAFGIIFEMPIFTLFLARLGIISAKVMRKGRKYAIVGIFILAAILTPPDVVSQLLMACPMLALYEISILVAVIFGKGPKKEESSEEKDASKNDDQNIQNQEETP